MGYQFIKASPLKIADENSVFDTVEYGCLKDGNKLDNYEIRGEANYRQCQEDGTWTKPKIYCQGLLI
jgi:hypothetical protein